MAGLTVRQAQAIDTLAQLRVSREIISEHRMQAEQMLRKSEKCLTESHSKIAQIDHISEPQRLYLLLTLTPRAYLKIVG